jgi:hypothetical protein
MQWRLCVRQCPTTNDQRPTTNDQLSNTDERRRRRHRAACRGDVRARRVRASLEMLYPSLTFYSEGFRRLSMMLANAGVGSLLSVPDSLSARAALPGSLRASRDALDRAPARIEALCVAQLARVDSRPGNTRWSDSPSQPSDGKPIAGLLSGHSPPDVLAKECRDE